MNYKTIYNRLKKSEDLFSFYENMTGIWMEDKDEFIEQHDTLQTLGDINYEEL